MNSRERTLSAVDGRSERIPFNPFIMHLAANLLNIDYARIYCQDAEELAFAQIKCAELYEIDHVNVSTDAFREASAWGVDINFTGHTPIAKKGSFLNWREFESIEEPDLLTAPRIQNRVDAIRILRKNSSDQCIIGWIEAPFAELCSMFDMVEILKICLYKEWQKIYQKLLRRIIPVQLEFAKLQIEAGADIIGAGDSAISQIGPKRYKEATLAVTQKLFTEIKKQVPVLYHCCGDNSKIDNEGNDMLKLIASTCASVIDIDYQVDLALAKEKLGMKVCIRGNTDTRLLGNPNLTIDQINRNIMETLKMGKQNGRYMYAAGCEWPWEPLEIVTRNLSAARIITKKYGKC